MSKGIKILKFVNGEELLVEITGMTSDIVVFKNAARIVIMPPQAPGQPASVGFADWVQYATDKEYTIDRNHIIIILNPVDSFVQQHSKMFSKIVTPPKSKLIL